MLGVVGGSGGVGASTCAAALADAAAGVLIDLDAVGAGIDVLLGMEHVAGARWSGVRVGGGFLDPAVMRDGLPYWWEVAVLALDSGPPDPADAAQVVRAAAQLAPVVVDLGRAPGRVRDEVVAECDLVLLLMGCEMTEISSAYATAELVGADVGVLVRPGPVTGAQAAAAIGRPLIAGWPSVRSPLTLRTRGQSVLHRRLRRAAGEVVDGVLSALPIRERAPT